MTAVLLDTHVWAWSLTNDARLSVTAREAMAQADAVLVSPISFFEIGQKVRLGKWPEMTPYVGRLHTLLETQGGGIADLNAEVCLDAAMMDWSHRDPFDRILAATALRRRVPILSADLVFDGVLKRVW